MNDKQLKVIIGLIAAFFVCICVSIACATLGGLTFSFWKSSSQEKSSGTAVVQVIPMENTPQLEFGTDALPTSTSSLEANGSGVEIVVTPESELDGYTAEDTLAIIENEPIPMNNPDDLAQRLMGKDITLATPQGAAPLYDLGYEKSFWASNFDDNSNFEVQAVLRYRTDHLYFWIEKGVDFSEQDLQRLCETFESTIYPNNRKYFGSEWTPGVDNDPHLYVLYARNLGDHIGGYFSSSDAYSPEVRLYSNGHEMFMVNADTVRLGGESIYGTMAHEFQHMIHWYQDRNEDVWISEGLSTLAQLLNGYRIGGSDGTFAEDPDLQLNTWPNSDNTFPHYGASFLYFAYFLDRFGADVLRDVVSQPKNGFYGIDAVLAEHNAVDSLRGFPIGGEDVFADWVVATYLNNPDVADGRYAYQLYDRVPKIKETEEIDQCSDRWNERDVSQFGADYIKINCSRNLTLKFLGYSEVGVVAEKVFSGKYAFWSNKGDESDMTLTRTFDFSSANGPLTLVYRTWYDLEEDFDYLYLEASEDGVRWDILQTPSGTDANPAGNSYGWGYTGHSGAWIEESVDISQYAGKKVQLRFEYVTDLAVNADGFLLDDVRIPEIQYAEDFENGDGGWEGAGFVRIQNYLPQFFTLSLIRFDSQITVDTIRLTAGQEISIPLELENTSRGAVLVVSGTTRVTTQPARYRFAFED